MELLWLPINENTYNTNVASRPVAITLWSTR